MTAACARSSGTTGLPDGCLRRLRDPRRPHRTGVGARRLSAALLTVMTGVSTAGFGDPARGDTRGNDLAFEVTYAAAIRGEPIATRVYVMLAPDDSSAEPRFGPDWFRPRPFFAVDV